MKPLFIAALLVSLFSAPAFAKGEGSYLSAFYGIASSSSDASAFDGIDGSVMGLTYGFFSSGSFAWELMARRTTFDKNSSSMDMSALGLGNITYSSEIESLLVGGGFRWFILNYLNVHLGLGYSSVKPNFTMSSTNTSALALMGDSAKDTSGLGIYYGAGVQIPLGKVDITADYTINNFSGDVASNEITGGLRLRF